MSIHDTRPALAGATCRHRRSRPLRRLNAFALKNVEVCLDCGWSKVTPISGDVWPWRFVEWARNRSLEENA